MERVLLIFDGVAWFVRHVRLIEHDLEKDEKVYHCDEHLGGPFTFDEGVAFLRGLQPHRTVLDMRKMCPPGSEPLG